MSLEGSTPLSQNPEGNTAAAISGVTDNLIVCDVTEWLVERFNSQTKLAVRCGERFIIRDAFSTFIITEPALFNFSKCSVFFDIFQKLIL